MKHDKGYDKRRDGLFFSHTKVLIRSERYFALFCELTLPNIPQHLSRRCSTLYFLTYDEVCAFAKTFT